MDCSTSPFVLDLTNAHLHSLSEIDVADSLTEIDLTCNRLNSIDPRIFSLTGLKSLSFRQNLLCNAEEPSKLKSKPTLEYLEFRDNQFTEIPNLSGFEKLQRLELSYNQIRCLQPLTKLKAVGLQSLFLASNKITAIECLDGFSNLKLLELGFNRIRQIENINHLFQLEELWLGRNRICQIQNMNTFTKLKKVSLQSNRLESMKGLETCVELEELYLCHNGITKIEGLESLVKLKVLDASNNHISKIEGLNTLVHLEDLWLNDNRIDQWEGIYESLEGLKETLSTIYLENNPIAEHPNYKTRIRVILPNLTQLDADDLIL